MAIFILLILIEILLYFTLICRYKKYKLFIIINTALFIIISGFRNIDVGADTENYYSFFNRMINMENFNWNSSSTFEYGFSLIVFLLGKIFILPRLMMIIVSMITLVLIAKFIYENSKNIFMSIFLFIGLNFLFESMNTTREFLAISIVLYAFKYVKMKEFLKYLIWIIIAASIHYTAILAIVIYFVYNIDNKKERKLKFIMVLLAGLSFIFINPVMQYITNLLPKYDAYLVRINSFKIYSIISLIINIFIYLYIAMCNKYNIKDKKINFYSNIALVTVCFSLLSVKMDMISRAMQYFSIFSIITLPNVTASVVKPETRKIFKMFIYICVVIYFLTIYFIRPDWIYVSNYSFSLN